MCGWESRCLLRPSTHSWYFAGSFEFGFSGMVQRYYGFRVSATSNHCNTEQQSAAVLWEKLDVRIAEEIVVVLEDVGLGNLVGMLRRHRDDAIAPVGAKSCPQPRGRSKAVT